MQQLTIYFVLLAFFGCTIIEPSPAKSRCEDGGLSITKPDGSGFWLPRVFTPNGDGLNDTFRIISHGVEHFTLQIYKDKKVVFTTSSSRNTWNGEIDGKKEDPATYRVVVNGRFRDYGEFSGTAHVYLVYSCYQNMKGCTSGDQFTDQGFIEGSTSNDPAIYSCQRKYEE